MDEDALRRLIRHLTPRPGTMRVAILVVKEDGTIGEIHEQAATKKLLGTEHGRHAIIERLSDTFMGAGFVRYD